MKLKLPLMGTAPSENGNVLVSVVTIALNAARDLPLTIESVAGQDFDNFEYVVVDGQSWDSSHEVFRRYAKEIDRLVETEDAGVYSAMNFAVTQCRGTYILFMNAGDTFYSARTLSNVFESLDGEEPDIIHGDHVYVDRSLELHKQSTEFPIIREALLQGEMSNQVMSQFPCHQATLTKRDLLTQMGGYDTRLEICADHDFFLRAYDQGATTKYVGETIAHYFGGGMSAQRGDRCRLEWIKVYRSKSMFPQKIDKFLGASNFVHFDSQSETTGTKLSGFYGLKPSSDSGSNSTYAWCAGEGFSVISPRKFEAIGLCLLGKNQLDDQRLTITSAGRTLCEVDIPIGCFEVEARFPYAIEPSSILEIFPSRALTIPDDHRFVSLLLGSFHFESIDAFDGKEVMLNCDYLFNRENLAVVTPLLRGGWSAPEASHVWSDGSQSTLRLCGSDEAEELTFVMSGNPYVAENLRHFKTLINGAPVGDDFHLTLAAEPQTIALTGTGWRFKGNNFVTFIPQKTASSSVDSRNLGICLYSMILK